MAISETDRALFEQWARTRVPAEHADKFRVEVRFRGNSAGIYSLEPPWKGDAAADWWEHRVAKLVQDPSTGRWKLFATDRNDRLLPYSDEFRLSSNLPALLAEIDRDPTGIFWG